MAAAASLAFYFYTQQHEEESVAVSSKSKKLDDEPSASADRSLDVDSNLTPKMSNASPEKMPPKKLDEDTRMEEKRLHANIEELDKKGKAFFKNKQYLEAAQAFTEALSLIESQVDHSNPASSSSLNKQIITLINNRSAMYEKGSFPELSLEDCNKILEVYDMSHVKARTRKLRILEKFKNNYEALVEVCALQLLYMQQNRDKLRMGLPASTPPPVPQSKLEELIAAVMPDELERYAAKMEAEKKDSLPSNYTLLQLLKSYTGYNAWMAKAARDGAVTGLQKQLDSLPQQSTDPTVVADKASLMMKMGRRYIYDCKYAKARDTIIEAYGLVKGKPEVQAVMKDDDYARLLEWAGMVRHWMYDLNGAEKCYKECVDLEPINAEILVKLAGVAMDGGKHDNAVKLFEKALSLDPDAVDALLHRANLRMLQANLTDAQTDLEHCIKLRPDHVLAHLRLAAVLTSKNDPLGAKQHLETAERVDPDSSEVQSYRGELFFTQQDFVQAKEQFEKAIKLEPSNPTPYVNAALAVLNTPQQPGGAQMQEIAKDACNLLDRAIEVDPHFQAAYVQLGQLQLGMAGDLSSAKMVIELYEKGLSYCRTKEDMKDLCSMKVLTQAQVDAATQLKMESFSMQ